MLSFFSPQIHFAREFLVCCWHGFVLRNPEEKLLAGGSLLPTVPTGYFLCMHPVPALQSHSLLTRVIKGDSSLLAPSIISSQLTLVYQVSLINAQIDYKSTPQ